MRSAETRDGLEERSLNEQVPEPQTISIVGFEDQPGAPQFLEGVKNGDWRWTGNMPASYASTDHATRWFCDRCGTPMAYESTRFENEIHFYAATLENPEDFSPTQHFHHGEHLSWLSIQDDLKRHDASSI